MRIGRKTASHAAQWMADGIRKYLLNFVMTLSNPCSVGLKVTSLKWTGPDPGAFEAPPQVPMDIEYSDTAQRSDDIGFPEDVFRGQESPINASAKDSSQSSADRLMTMESPHKDENTQEAAPDSQKIVGNTSQERPEIPPESLDSEEATQDKAERIKLQLMLPASVNLPHIDFRSIILTSLDPRSPWCR